MRETLFRSFARAISTTRVEGKDDNPEDNSVMEMAAAWLRDKAAPVAAKFAELRDNCESPDQVLRGMGRQLPGLRMVEDYEGVPVPLGDARVKVVAKLRQLKQSNLLKTQTPLAITVAMAQLRDQQQDETKPPRFLPPSSFLVCTQGMHHQGNKQSPGIPH